jgi:cytochrome c7-like protein/cytochrome c554/c'-like protein
MAVVLSGALLAAAPATAQLHPSRCADCHAANQGKPDPLHFIEWHSSAHERAGVGCEKCHGGNPNTFESFLAHQSIIRGRGPETPVHPANLPKTCGACHRGPFAQFQKSRHATLLAQQVYDGPTCSTCHGYAAGYTMSPKGLEKQCSACHGVKEKAARPGRAADARDWLQNVRDVRQLLDSAQTLIKRTKDAKARELLDYDYQQAQVPLTEAVHDGHAFVFTDARERLAIARARADALLERLANGPGR